MSFWKARAAIAGITLSPLIAIGVIYGAPAISRHFNPQTASVKGSEGARREAVLATATERFVAKGELVTDQMKAGKELAPTEFLNAELERLGLKWRVGTTDGMAAETYSVS